MTVDAANQTKAIVDKALASFGEISTLPEVTVKIIEVVEDPNGTARELHEIIKRDPALSAKILKVVNSAFYGLPGQVASVDRAIVLLGLSAVKNIAVAASIARMFDSKQAPGLFDAKDLWRHCVAVGVAAKKIADVSGRFIESDEMFLAGLIHDLGLLLERQLFPEGLVEVVKQYQDGNGVFVELEHQVIGANHQEFGEALTEQWRFPSHLRAAVGHHHTPADITEELHRVVAILHCADTLCCQEGLGFSMTAEAQEFTQELLDTVGITIDQLAEIRDNLAEGLEEAEAVLGAKG